MVLLDSITLLRLHKLNQVRETQTDPLFNRFQGNFVSLWATYGSPVRDNISCWRYDEFEGYKRIGDFCNTTSFTTPNLECKLDFVQLCIVLTNFSSQLLKRSRPMLPCRAIPIINRCCQTLSDITKFGLTRVAMLI